jgi:hypothetical protein
MARAVPALRRPDPAAVVRVPSATLDGEVHRAQWAHHDPWWFSTRTGNLAAGRFDLALPHGTCYFADDPLGALIEKLADPEQEDPLVPAEDLERLHVWSVTLPPPWDVVADTTDRASRVSKELGCVVPYEVCWEWADALHHAGRSGLRYWLRLDPGAGRGVAVFGGDGTPPGRPALRGESATRYTEQLRDSFDLVVPTITSGELIAADPEAARVPARPPADSRTR